MKDVYLQKQQGSLFGLSGCVCRINLLFIFDDDDDDDGDYDSNQQPKMTSMNTTLITL